MRDPERIDFTLEVLRKYWEKYPQLRLGQIISNLLEPGRDVFYLEDDVLATKLIIATQA